MIRLHYVLLRDGERISLSTRILLFLFLSSFLHPERSPDFLEAANDQNAISRDKRVVKENGSDICS